MFKNNKISLSRKILTAAMVAVLALCGSASLAYDGPIVETDIDHDTEARAERNSKKTKGTAYVVVVYPPQSHVKNPYFLAPRANSSRHLFSPSYQIASPEVLRFLVDNGPQERERLPLGPSFDIEEPMNELVDSLDNGAIWVVADVLESAFVDHPNYPGALALQADEIRRQTYMENVLFVEVVIMLTPDLRQLRVVAKFSSLPSGSLFSGGFNFLATTVNYLSDEQAPPSTAWDVDDRESMAAAIDEVWNREIMQLEVEKALQDIGHLAATALAKMDKPKARKRRSKTFDYIDWRGQDRIIRGEIASEDDNRTVVRSTRGNLYSFPTKNSQ